MLCAGDAGDKFEGEEGDAAGGQFGGRLGRAQRIAHANDHLARAESRAVGTAGFGIGPGGADLKDHLGGGEQFVPALGDPAPLSVYNRSGNPAASPAPLWINTSRPALVRLGMMSGTSATRFSPGKVSWGTAIIIICPICRLLTLLRLSTVCWGGSCTVLLGWQLYCHPYVPAISRGWQCNCHPNDGKLSHRRGRPKIPPFGKAGPAAGEFLLTALASLVNRPING